MTRSQVNPTHPGAYQLATGTIAPSVKPAVLAGLGYGALWWVLGPLTVATLQPC